MQIRIETKERSNDVGKLSGIWMMRGGPCEVYSFNEKFLRCVAGAVGGKDLIYQPSNKFKKFEICLKVRYLINCLEPCISETIRYT